MERSNQGRRRSSGSETMFKYIFRPWTVWSKYLSAVREVPLRESFVTPKNQKISTISSLFKAEDRHCTVRRSSSVISQKDKNLLAETRFPACGLRCLSSRVSEIFEAPQSLHVRFANEETTKFHYIWLRDHCNCSECYHPITYQKQVDTFKIPLDIKPHNISVEDDGLQIEWKDGHVSNYNSEWLYKHQYGQPYECFDIGDIKKELWNGQGLKDVPDSQFSEVMEDDEKLLEYLEKLLRYGIAFIDGVAEPYPESLRQLGERVGQIQRTHYGDVWTFTSGNVEFADTAYLSIKLECHNDGTYFFESPGLQLLHCNAHIGGTGGENVFADGFYVANKLKKTDPAAFNFLSSKKIPSYYYEKDEFLFKAYDTILKLDDLSKEIYQIRFNSNDRDVLSCLSFEDVETFYKASHKLTSLIRDPSNELVVTPRPGRAALFDNWRVFHARNSFTGQRTMTGYYVQRGAFLSKIHALRERLGKN